MPGIISGLMICYDRILVVCVILVCVCPCMLTGWGRMVNIYAINYYAYMNYMWVGPVMLVRTMSVVLIRQVGGARCLYGMWYFGEVTKLCAYVLCLKCFSGTTSLKRKGPTWSHYIPLRFILNWLFMIILWCCQNTFMIIVFWDNDWMILNYSKWNFYLKILGRYTILPKLTYPPKPIEFVLFFFIVFINLKHWKPWLVTTPYNF